MTKQRKQWPMEVYGHDISCKQFYDCDSDCDGVDVYVNGKHTGECWGITIPNPEEPEQVEEFEDAVENWLEENYF